jgi:hypothetical protein
MKKTDLTQDPGKFLLMTAYAGYDVYELFQDKNPTMGWVNTGAWTVGLLFDALDPIKSLGSPYFNISRATPYLAYDFTYSFCYPIVTLVDGTTNKNGNVDRAWIGLGSDLVLIESLALIERAKNDSTQKADITPVVSPQYSGLVWSKTF